MTAHVPRFPFSFDPLIAAAKQRSRQRRTLVLVALALVLAGAAAGAVATRALSGASGKVTGPGSTTAIRRCGQVGIGPGWPVWASGSLSCSSGRAVIRAYLMVGIRHQAGLADHAVLAYACSVNWAARVRCVSIEQAGADPVSFR